MDDPVNDRYRNIVIVEKLPPTGEVLIGSQDDGSVLVQAVDQLKQVVAGLAEGDDSGFGKGSHGAHILVKFYLTLDSIRRCKTGVNRVRYATPSLKPA